MTKLKDAIKETLYECTHYIHKNLLTYKTLKVPILTLLLFAPILPIAIIMLFNIPFSPILGVIFMSSFLIVIPWILFWIKVYIKMDW